jgi:hypothetical protein
MFKNEQISDLVMMAMEEKGLVEKEG